MLFRILTEDKNRKEVEKIVSRKFDGFTIYQATGYWKGLPEASLIIEVEASEKKFSLIKELAQIVRAVNEQEAVLVEKIRNESVLV